MAGAPPPRFDAPLQLSGVGVALGAGVGALVGVIAGDLAPGVAVGAVLDGIRFRRQR